ncbi:hypothetical protein GALL_196860 [mine drainage metagenome]|uniref:Uncharacterized protein n=1 Tax=mine drainage metagenome TaxID=410659 RepID=A0A1J5RRC7_9ZZZZ
MQSSPSSEPALSERLRLIVESFLRLTGKMSIKGGVKVPEKSRKGSSHRTSILILTTFNRSHS